MYAIAPSELLLLKIIIRTFGDFRWPGPQFYLSARKKNYYSQSKKIPKSSQEKQLAEKKKKNKKPNTKQNIQL